MPVCRRYRQGEYWSPGETPHWPDWFLWDYQGERFYYTRYVNGLYVLACYDHAFRETPFRLWQRLNVGWNEEHDLTSYDWKEVVAAHALPRPRGIAERSYPRYLRDHLPTILAAEVL